MKQKLVSVFLHDKGAKGKDYGDPDAGAFYGVKEHLREYLADGWRIREFKTMCAAGGCLSGWIVVLLEK